MKKTVKKLRLTLTKETLRKLENGQLVDAAGATGHSCGYASICFETDPTFTCYC